MTLDDSLAQQIGTPILAACADEIRTSEEFPPDAEITGSGLTRCGT